MDLEPNLILISPTKNLKKEFEDFILEWKQSGEELIPWSLTLSDMNYDLMVENLDMYSRGMNLPEGFVPSSTYWLINKDKRILGAIDIRHELNDFLRFRGGHIGYGIRPTERNKGYASQMLSLAVAVCKEIGMKKVLITCLKVNIASAKVIQQNGGILESEAIDKEEVFQRYWIDL